MIQNEPAGGIHAKMANGDQNPYGLGLQVENLEMEPAAQNYQNNYYSSQQVYGLPPGQRPMQGMNYPNNMGDGMLYNGYGQPMMMMPMGQPIQGIPMQMQNQYGGMPMNHIVIVDGQQQIKSAIIFRLRRNIRWFSGCNAYFTILLLLNILTKINLYNNQASELENDTRRLYSRNYNSNYDDDLPQSDPNGLIKASAIISIIMYIIWFLLILLGVHGLSSNKIHFVTYYIRGLYVCIGIETLAHILLFAGFGEWKAISKVTFVIAFILTILILLSFIRNARNILLDVQSFKDKFNTNPLDPNPFQNAPANGQQNQQGLN